jgi:hypothetical protein
VPALTILRCECGILLRSLHKPDAKKQVYVCENCQREIEFTGTVLQLDSCSANTMSDHREWTRVPLWRIKELPRQ